MHALWQTGEITLVEKVIVYFTVTFSTTLDLQYRIICVYI